MGGANTGSPNLPGNENSLARDAAASIANYFDDDSHDAFVTAYIYQRNLTDSDGNALNNPTDDASVLSDLIKQVDDAYEGGVTGAYTIDALALIAVEHPRIVWHRGSRA